MLFGSALDEVVGRHHGWALETEVELIALGREGAPQIPAADIEAAVKAMQLPGLIVHGADDHIFSHESSLELHKRIPHAWLITMDGAGHLPTGRYPVRINNAIKTFADEICDRTPATLVPV